MFNLGWCSRGFVVCWAVSLVGCSAPEYRAPQPPSVTVAPPLRRSVGNDITTTAIIAGSQEVDVRPRIAGTVTRISFQPGASVRAGDVLFELDADELKSALRGAQADVQSATVALRRADEEFKRRKALAAAGADTARELEIATATRDGAAAALSAARARADGAAASLDYATLRAPFAGRMSMRQVDVGARVAPSGPPLATLVDASKVRVSMGLSEREVRAARRALEQARDRDAGVLAAARALPVRLGFDGVSYPFAGSIDAVENRFHTATGTLTVYATFENPTGQLMPGLTASVQLVLPESEAVLVPDAAVGLDAVGRYVFVVTGDQRIERRSVTLGARVGRARRIDSGLSPQDVVVVDGLMRVRVGSEVTPESTTLDALGLFGDAGAGAP